LDNEGTTHRTYFILKICYYYTVRIVNPETLKEVETNHVGEIWVSSYSSAAGYFNDEKLSKTVFYNRFLKLDGTFSDAQFLRTGDLGVQYKGQLYVVGRIKDIIIVRGRNYSPHDIEQLVESIPYIRPGTAAAFCLNTAMLQEYGYSSNMEMVGIVAEVIERKKLVPQQPHSARSLMSGMCVLFYYTSRQF
jgi:acyl-CoA synthetase (AMP-forming)/AMP-acid ligase II